MRSSSIFQGDAPPLTIVNAQSTGSSIISRAAPSSAKKILSGALTANTLATILSISGAGVVDWLSANPADTTSRTIRLKITIDGVVAFDATSSAMTNTASAILGIGISGSSTESSSQPCTFKTSLLVEVASSLTETDKVQLSAQYRTN